jgi:Protein of unknown function (DUF2919)
MIDDRTLDVNEYGVLRIPTALWLALVLQCRHSVFGLLLLFAGQQGQTVWQLLDTKSTIWLFLMEIPALLAVFVCAARRPEAGGMVRILWSWLAVLVSISAMTHIGYAVWYLWHSSYWLPWPEMAMACLALLDAAIIYALFREMHWQAVFAEFPSLNG